MAKRKESSDENSWKNLQLEGVRSSKKKPSRRKIYRVIKGVFGLVWAFILGGAIFTLLYFLQQEHNREAVQQGGPEHPIRQVILNTDGVLNIQWLHKNLNIEKNVDLAKVDIRGMRDQLLRHGQIRSVRVRREYPDQLVFDIQEHRPFAKVVALDSNGERFLLLVSPEGDVYRGVNYPIRMLSDLPYLGGVPLSRQGEGFAPLAGMENVKDLWETARKYFPYFLDEWIEINIAEYFPARAPYLGVIKVRSKKIPQIVFSPRNYLRQLQQLDLIQYRHKDQPDYLLRVDFTTEGQAAVLPAY